jgi:Uma2 family endonuclease
MASVIRVSPQAGIEYPDSDGKPMSDHTLQYKWIVIIREGLAGEYADDPNVFVGANLLWYAVEGKPAIRSAPDVLIAFGRPPGERGSYKQWQEGGIAPQVVFEVRSPGNRPGEMKRKFEFYQRYGVDEYYMYDPFSGSLDGWRRRGGALKKIARMRGFVSPRLLIRFEPLEGQDNLTIFGRDGQPFITPQEMSRRLALAERRVENATLRADNAELRAEQYAAKLRELGIEPY